MIVVILSLAILFLLHVIILITPKKLYIKEKFRNRPNTLKFKEIITFKNKYDLQKLCRFVVIIDIGVCPFERWEEINNE